MSSIKKIRESVETKLDKLDARVDALQAALKGSQDQSGARIEHHKQEVRRALEKLTADIDEHPDLSEARRREIRSLVDNLDEQITLSQSAARETLAYARQQISDAAQKMETELDAALAESKAMTAGMLHASMNTYARAVDKLDAELEAAEMHVVSAKDRLDAALEKRRQEISHEITKLKQRLGEKKAQASEKLSTFEAEMREGFEKMARSFKDLFH